MFTVPKRKAAAWFVLGCGLALAVSLVVNKVVSTGDTIQAIRATQKVSFQNVKTTKALARDIRSCTSPGGKCYQRGQKQTAKAVGDISVSNQKSAAAAAWCAQDRHTYETILRCVNRQLGIPPTKR